MTTSHTRIILPLAVIAIFAAATGMCTVAVADSDAIELFEKQIRPTLIAQCVRCHGEEKQQGGLNLETRDGWARGGDSGPAIVPGDQESLLLRAISYQDTELEMPPRGKLPEQTIEAFRRWIEQGAVDPRTTHAAPTTGSDVPTVEEGRSFWSFQPVTAPPVPDVGNAGWPRTDIDRFVLKELESAAVGPVADAEPEILLRRLYYDLIGLPPTPEEIEQFRSDHSPTAYLDVVDRLLDSHHFGQRWGRHWLDVVRFAESSGGGRTLLFPDAWRYRDYVIDAFNSDLPYDRFLTEQIAGDLLAADNWQQKRRQIVATAFLLLGPINYEMQDKQILEMDVVDEQLDTIGKAFMGMTIGCARCHDHKFDPIPAHDYYAMAGILKGTQSLVHSNVSKWNMVELPLSPDEEASLKSHEAKIAATRVRLDEATARWREAGGKPEKKKTGGSIDPAAIPGVVLDDDVAERVGPWTESTSIGGYVGGHYIHDATDGKGQKSVVYRPAFDSPGRHEVLVTYTASSNRSTRVPVHIHHAGGETVVHVNQRQTPPLDHSLVSLGTFEFEPDQDHRIVISNEGTEDGVVIADAVVLRPETARAPGDAKIATGTDDEPATDPAVLKELKKAVDEIAAELKKLQQSGPKRPVAMATADSPEASDIPLAIRGQVHLQGPVTPRGVMQVAQWEPFSEISQGQSGRRELARWITDPRHPLTSRVMANRVWYWLMGRGLVSSVDNFGSMGERPSHPELLDHLASSFVAQGWSVKQLVREIVRSRVYQLATDSSTSASASDRASIDPENRLLWRMNRKRLRAEDIRDSLLMISGQLDLRAGGPAIKPGTSIEYGYEFDSTRRSVYVPVFRNTLPEIFEVFDFADPNIQIGARNSSTVASQALLLMNHPDVIRACRRAAEDLLEKPGMDFSERIRHAHLQVLGRVPNQVEYSVAVDLIGPASDNEAEAATRWMMLYQVLFQSLDFRYLD